MSLDYASALSEYENKGVCGIPEVRDPDYIFEQKVSVLTDLLRHSSYTVVHTGAGLSTSAGIPDFRGPDGVWTLEKKGKKPAFSKSFTEARPSVGHMALVALERAGYINFVITQNIDGLHLRSGFPRNRLSILHGDVFMEKCTSCGTVYVRSTKVVPTFGLKPTGARCTKMKTRVRLCGGKLRDSVLDWEDELPEPDYAIAVKEARKANLQLCMGTSLQIYPAAGLPFTSKQGAATASSSRKRKHPEDHNVKPSRGDSPPHQPKPSTSTEASLPKVVIVNLQPTKFDARADICLRGEIDRVLTRVCQNLGVEIPIVENEGDVFIPKIVLRSKHTAKSERFPWNILSHPDNEISPFASDEDKDGKEEEDQTANTKRDKNEPTTDNKPTIKLSQ